MQPQGVNMGRATGESMVKRHHEKLQAEKEAKAMSMLRAAMPKLSQAVIAFALQDCGIDAERALSTLRQFQSECVDDLDKIQHKRRRLQMRAPSPTASGSSASSGEIRKSGKGHKGKQKDKEKSKHKKSKEKHKKRKEAKSKSKHKLDRAGKHQEGRELGFGAFGIIREKDYQSKRPEFAAWASEVKHIDIEVIPRGDERELFLEYLEDFNTCTLPHKKYYDLSEHARTGAGDDEHMKLHSALGDREGYGGDEELRKAELKAERQQREDEAAREAMMRIMMTREHLSELKQREMIRLQAQDAYKTGDRDKAQKLMKKLNPDEEDVHAGPDGY